MTKINEYLEMYPYLKDLSKTILFLDKEVIDNYNNDLKIDATNKSISIKLLSDLMTIDNYYIYVEKLFNDEINEFDCRYIINGDVGGSIKLTKKDIILGLSYALERDSFSLNKTAYNRYQKLSKLITFDALKEKYQDYTHSYTVDGKEFNITFNDILYFFNNYNNFIETNQNYKGIKKEYLVYGIKDFFNQPTIKNTYYLPLNISLILKEITHENKIDIEALDTFLETNYDYINEIEINDELKNEIFKNIPDELNQLEKAIYIYIKMCKLLKYDAEFFAVDQKGISALKHENIDNIKTITPKNNEIVCYEFIAIYAKLLNELGINLEVTSNLLDKYGGAHAICNFRIDKYLISADAVTTILNGDLIRAKLNKPLEGLKCTNKNHETKKEFNHTVNKVYNIINQEELQIEHHETFDDILIKYKQTTSNDVYLDIEEKLELLMDVLNNTDFRGMDAFSYILMLRKIIFNGTEQEFNIKITIIRNNELTYNNKEALPSAIITINQIDINNINTNTYYLYNPGQPLYYISYDKLLEKFDDNVYEYIKQDDIKIPGMTI